MDKKIIKELEAIAGKKDLLVSDTELFLYGYDAGIDRAKPDAVVFPESRHEVCRIVRLASRYRIPFLPRGSGTNLSGGTIPVKGGIVLEFSRMNRILDIDVPNQRAVVEPGVYNLDLQNALSPLGYLFVPDPASQKVSTIGGNIGEDSGGPHCLKYGVTSNHVLGLEVVTADGEIINLGGKSFDPAGYDLLGLLIGSEGTLAIATKITLRIMRQPEYIKTVLAIFNGIVEAGDAVSAIIAEGIIPATLEMMDKTVIQAVEASVHAGYPLDAGAVLIIELDGLKDGQEKIAGVIKGICVKYGASEVKESRDMRERDELWAGRRGAFGSLTRLMPSYLVNDGTVPRTKLPEVLKRVEEIGRKYSLSIGNVFHAGDGNLHPNILYDDRNPEEKRRALKAGYEILKACVELGGTISGEHGIGTEKIEAMSFVFKDAELRAMKTVKDVFDPHGLCNPGKVLPENIKFQDYPHLNPQDRPSYPLEEGSNPLPLREREACSPSAGVRGEGFESPESLQPKDVQEVSEILSSASSHNKTVLPSGYGTKLSWGGTSSKADIILSTSLLTGIIDYDPANLTVTAGAGTKLGDLQKELGRNRQFLPLDPPFFDRCTLGGLAAANLSGPRRYFYGSPRDIILGLEVVLTNGEIVRFGGKTVKNVSGYAMHKLFIGSWGGLGVITELTFKLLAMPEKSATLLIFHRDLSYLAGLAGKILSSNLLPAAVQLINPPALAALDTGPVDEVYALALSLEGYEEAVKRQVSEISSMTGQSRIKLMEKDDADDFWRRVSEITALIPHGESVICKANVVMSEAGEMISSFENEDSQVLITGSAACGTIWAVFPVSGRDADSIISSLMRLRAKAVDSDGYFRVLTAPAGIIENTEAKDLPAGENKIYNITKMLKTKFDPKGILGG